MNWPLTIALLLILLKQFYKLFVNHEPDRIDYLKALATLPIDASFLVVGLFVRAATRTTADGGELIGLMVAYLIVSFIATALWRVCDTAVTNRFGANFLWAFPLNTAICSVTFYVAIRFVGAA